MLTTLKRIVQEVNQIPILDEAIGHLVTRVKHTLSVDACSMYLADYATQTLTLVATEGLAESAVGVVKIGFSDTVNETLSLLSDKFNVAQIATKRALSESTIYGHVAVAIEEGVVDPMEVLPINAAEYQLIAQSIALHGEETSLKTIFDSLDQVFDFGVIRCVAAAENTND